MSPSVSVIIVSWNARPLLEQCFPSVAASEYPDLEIVLADNASTDDSVAWMQRHYPDTRIIQHPQNWRFARGNNEAIRATESQYVVLLNNDVEVSPDWLTALIDVMERMPDVGALQPKILSYERRSQFEYAGASGGFLDMYGYPFARGRIFDHVEPDRGQYDDARDVFWASGAAMVLRRAALDEVGLLDEDFEMHMEEIDLCWRLQRHGWRVRVEPRSTVFHIGGSSLARGDARKTYYNFRNSLLMLYKNLSPVLWRRTFPRRAALDAAAATRGLSMGRISEARAIVRAYRDAHILRGRYAGVRPASDEALPAHVYLRSIARDFFLRKRKTFSELPVSRFTVPEPNPKRPTQLK